MSLSQLASTFGSFVSSGPGDVLDPKFIPGVIMLIGLVTLAIKACNTPVKN
jgi:hypothetical protein